VTTVAAGGVGLLAALVVVLLAIGVVVGGRRCR
jgi:hypothetical protein